MKNEGRSGEKRLKMVIIHDLDSNNNVTKPISSEDYHQNFTSITLNTQALMRQNRLAFSVYDEKTGLFDDYEHRILTRVISLTVDKPEAVKHSGSFVKIAFQLDSEFQQRNQSLQCAFWNIFDNMTAKWSTEGCRMESIKQQRVTCICNHLTHFAVLMV